MQSEQSFREEVRAWLLANAPESLRGSAISDLDGVWGGRKWQFESIAQRQWLERMADKGWTAPTWPTQYGGGGLDEKKAAILKEELRAQKLPSPLVGFGLNMIGPVLLSFGTEAQKLAHLPAICRGEIRWCQGYSEPGAGSDLASLKTSAIRNGNSFVLNGSKLWTSGADVSDWMFALVRTNTNGVARQDGITFILIDMQTKGITVRPIPLIYGDSTFCETHFDDVYVPVTNVVHKVDEGWAVAKALLGHERTMIADMAGVSGTFSQSQGNKNFFADLAKQYVGRDDTGRIADHCIRRQLVTAEMDARGFALTVRRSQEAAMSGRQPGAETSMFKVYGTELSQRRHDVMAHILGSQGLGWTGAGFESSEIDMARAWLRSRSDTIGGGTTEIQLNVIAKRVLGLPD